MTHHANLHLTVHTTGVSKAPALLSTEQAASAQLAQRLARTGLALGPAMSWGRTSTLDMVHNRRPAVIFLDVPSASEQQLTGLVRAARLLAPVTVLPPDGQDTLTAFTAGALNVLDRKAPAAELAWRIRADLRSCPPPPASTRHISWSAGQSLLFDILAAARTPVCCHHLRLLMGSPGLPMNLRALKARIHRMRPALAQSGMTLVVDQQWGLATFRTQPADSVALLTLLA